MAEYFVRTAPKRRPTHPGAILREDVLPTMRISVSEFARRISVSRQVLHRILAESHGITPEMALRIGEFLGNGPELWLRLQQDYDLWQARGALKPTLDRIRRNKAA
ncbi:MAG: HigA family addiction module antitoxin [Sulfuricaulis sp.]